MLTICSQYCCALY